MECGAVKSNANTITPDRGRLARNGLAIHGCFRADKTSATIATGLRSPCDVSDSRRSLAVNTVIQQGRQLAARARRAALLFGDP